MLLTFLIFLALFPVFLIGFILYKVDKEKESIKSMILFYGLGLFAAFLASILESIFYLSGNDLIIIFIDSFIFIALVEELAKLLCMFIGTKMVKSYDNFFDSIVFCTAVSLGFAGIENILYVLGNSFSSGSTLITGISTGLLRAFLSVPGHAIFAIYMGFFLDKFKSHKIVKDGTCGAYLALAMILPIVLHGLYDFMCLSMAYIDYSWYFILFIGYVVFLYASGIILLVLGAKKSHIRFDGAGSNGGYVYKCVSCGEILSYTVCQNCGTNNMPYIEAINKYAATYGSYPVIPQGPFKICPKCGNFSQGYFCNKCGNVL
jgi:RsiW-degrading membrane proteinase PrsW (M82 family)